MTKAGQSVLNCLPGVLPRDLPDIVACLFTRMIRKVKNFEGERNRGRIYIVYIIIVIR